MNGKDLPEVVLNFDAELRKWCLERAFETRELSGVSHMEVTNVADDYYQWIVCGQSQGNRQLDQPIAEGDTEGKRL